MKKIEELYETDKLPADIAEDYEMLLKCLNDMEELTEVVGFGNAHELDGEDWDKYCGLRNRLIQIIVKIIRGQDKEFDFQILASSFGEPDFWEEVEEDISKQTREFLSMQPLRKIGIGERKRRYPEVFAVLYDECETAGYMSRKLGLDEKIATLYTRVLRFSEDLILNYCISRRLFHIRFRNFCGLDAGDADFLWELYSNASGRLERVALKNRLNDINYRVSRLVTQLEEVQDRLDVLEYMMFSDDEETAD